MIGVWDGCLQSVQVNLTQVPIRTLTAAHIVHASGTIILKPLYANHGHPCIKLAPSPAQYLVVVGGKLGGRLFMHICINTDTSLPTLRHTQRYVRSSVFIPPTLHMCSCTHIPHPLPIQKHSIHIYTSATYLYMLFKSWHRETVKLAARRMSTWTRCTTRCCHIELQSMPSGLCVIVSLTWLMKQTWAVWGRMLKRTYVACQRVYTWCSLKYCMPLGAALGVHAWNLSVWSFTAKHNETSKYLLPVVSIKPFSWQHFKMYQCCIHIVC